MEHDRKNIAVLGSTGSIGRNALEIAGLMKNRFRVVGLAAGSNIALLLKQAAEFKPEVVSLRTEREAAEFRRKCNGGRIRVTFGSEGASEMAGRADIDIVVSAITGIDGLKPTLAAVKAGKKVALANKESMVIAGSFLKREAFRSGAKIMPVDSEHSGVFQCLAKEKKTFVRRIILTASGGPFFRTPTRDLETKTVEDALLHPRWKMGRKVTVDSATLMNKGLELIEARWLFGFPPDRLDVLIHPQSIVHSLVEMRDGSILAQLSQTDMRIPIQYALTYPEREESAPPLLDLSSVRSLEFYPVDERKFPLFTLARTALKEGQSVPVALNAANEAVVEAFLARKIRFGRIAGLVEACLAAHEKRPVRSVDEVFTIDGETRARAKEILKKRI